MIDREVRGNTAKGEAIGTSKLKTKQVVEIRQLLRNGKNQQAIALRYGVHQGTISRIKRNKTWKEVK